MKLAILASILFLSAVPLHGQVDSLTIDNPRMVWPDSTVSIDPNQTFTLGQPGMFKADLLFTGHDIDPNTGDYIAPELDALWSIKDGKAMAMGGAEWHGGDQLLGVIPILSWNRTTGAGVAEISIPIGGEWNLTRYPFFGSGTCDLRIDLGQTGMIGLDSSGQPVGEEWAGQLIFATDLPPKLALVEEKSYERGDSALFLLFFDSVSTASQVITVETIGRPVLTPAGMSPGGPWQFTVPQGMRQMGITMWIDGNSPAGTFKVRATLPNGSTHDSQLTLVLDDYPVAPDYDGTTYLESPAGGGSPEDPTQTLQEDKRCRLAKSAAPNGDKMLNCTRPFVELVEPPINPNCGTTVKSYFYPTQCKKKRAKTCLFGPDAPVTVTELVYAGTEDREVGELEVSMGVSADGELGFWLIGELELGVTAEGRVMSKVVRRCCKFQFNGQSHEINQPTCQ